MTSGKTTSFRGPLAERFGDATRLAETLLPADQALAVAPASDRGIWDATSGSADRPTLDDLVRRAAADLDAPWPQPLASQAVRVHRDGNRSEWEGAAFARQEKLSRQVVAAAATLESRFLDAAADGIVLLCEQSTWCWPAHDDALRRHSSVLPDVDDPFLDLGAAEVAAQLAWIDQLLGSHLEASYPGLRERMRREVRLRVFVPFLERRDWHWLGLDGDAHNWNPWIHGNLIVAALRLLDGQEDAGTRGRIVALAIEGIDRYVAALPEDGAIDEGYGYWWNGACRALEALAIVSHATGAVIDPFEIPALRATVAFPHRMQLGGRWYVSFADSQARSNADHPWHAVHRAARRAGDRDAMAHAASHRRPGGPVASEGQGLGRLLIGLTDSEWRDVSPGEPPLPREVHLPSIQLAVARPHSGTVRGLTVSVKGGHNGEHHNHNDVGSFIVASDGVPVIVDPGRPSYALQTFGPERYEIWAMQSSWHSVPEIRGFAQRPGHDARARDVSLLDGGLGLDLAEAYPVAGLDSWRREVRLDREAAEVRITDTWELDPWSGATPEPATALRIMIAGAVLLGDGEARVEPLDGTTPVLIRWPGEICATLVTRLLDDSMLTDVWGPSLARLDLDVTDHRTTTVVVTQTQEGSE